MFQKCPKCDGTGIAHIHMKAGKYVYDENNKPKWEPQEVKTDPCPLCLGEFVIHEEQGVPPSKVKAVNPKPSISFCDCDVDKGCALGSGACRFALKNIFKTAMDRPTEKTTTLQNRGFGPDPEDLKHPGSTKATCQPKS